MRCFLRDFYENLDFVLAQSQGETVHVSLGKDSFWGEWTMCMLLWTGFAQSKDATLDKSLRDKWLEVSKEPDQVIFLSTLTECLMHPSTTHPLWTLPDFKSCTCQKDNAAGIFFTDRVVQHALRGNEERKERWGKEVVNDWFNNTADAASDFIIRANKFLREDMEDSSMGMSIFESVVKTQSYVVFLKMTGLAASLLFGYLEASKLAFACGAGAAGGGARCWSEAGAGRRHRPGRRWRRASCRPCRSRHFRSRCSCRRATRRDRTCRCRWGSWGGRRSVSAAREPPRLPPRELVRPLRSPVEAVARKSRSFPRTDSRNPGSDALTILPS
jgi:hypothetical protein